MKAVLLLLFVPVLFAASNDVIIKNLKLFVGGNEFFIKGMCYSPAPLGTSGNGGFCSIKTTPYGSEESACYDSDYFDGSSDVPNRVPGGPKGWFQPVWNRDFPHLVQLGVNTVRLYSANPTTRQASIDYPSAIPFPYGKDHTQFMDLAAQYGLKVMFPLIGDYGMMTSYSTEDFQQLLRWQIEEIGNHSALLMWTLGNELPLSNTGLVPLLNSYINYARAYTLSYWGRHIPVTCAVVDNPSTYNLLASTLDVDVFTTNAGYRGTSFTDLWSGNTVTSGWKALSCQYNKPVFIGEMGWMSLNDEVDMTQPAWFNSLYEDLVGHIDQGCIGGSFFEYQDESWKSDPLQQTMGVVSVTPHIVGSNSSIMPNVWLPDIVTPKANIYSSVQTSYAGSNVFAMAGRPQYTIDTVPNTCSWYYSSSSSTSTISSATVASSTSTKASSSAISSTIASTKVTSSVTNAASSSTSSTKKATSSATVTIASSNKATTAAKGSSTSTTKATSTASSAKVASSSTASVKAASSKVSVSTISSVTSKVAITSSSKVTSASSSSSTTGVESAACISACGAASCCPTPAPTCYQDSLYSCIPSGSSNVLCGKTTHNNSVYAGGLCGSGCYDTFCYNCVNNVLAPSGKC